MTARARLAVRLMSRTRDVDVFEMVVVDHDPALLALEAAQAAGTICDRIAAPLDRDNVARDALNLAFEQTSDTGFTVRTRLLDDSWLLLVRIDRRTGPATRHAPRMPQLAIAA